MQGIRIPIIKMIYGGQGMRQFHCLYLFAEKKGEKHGKHGPNIECINKAFKVRFENFLIPLYT